MRALITFIAILTVGIVTAQVHPPRFDQNGTPDVQNDNTLVVNSETYIPVGELSDDLHAWYPLGTSRVNQFRQEDIGIRPGEVRHITIHPASGVQNGTHRGYNVFFHLDGGVNVSFNGDIPTETFSTNRNGGMRITSSFTGSRAGNGFNAAIGYSATTTITFDYNTNVAHNVDGTTENTVTLGVYVLIGLTHPNGDTTMYGIPLTLGGPGYPTAQQNFDNSTQYRPSIPSDGTRQHEYGRQPNVELTKVNIDGSHTSIITDINFDYTLNHRLGQ